MRQRSLSARNHVYAHAACIHICTVKHFPVLLFFSLLMWCCTFSYMRRGHYKRKMNIQKRNGLRNVALHYCLHDHYSRIAAEKRAAAASDSSTILELMLSGKEGKNSAVYRRKAKGTRKRMETAGCKKARGCKMQDAC